ncbi:peroxidase P7 [Selaginella moellendorffii]|nr:peroxidase P7 [Selaginella moellendorffii]|eukprot:XP_002980450.2 peroxidase P7 [Selaginella moellendorffii]
MKFVFVLCICLVSAAAQLSPTFYDSSCPKLLSTVRSVLERAVQREPRMAASLLRLHFHDCFVNGCDGSVLLDDKPGFRGEKTSNPNRNSARGFEVVDSVKAAVERVCPGVVSCADILAIIAEQSVVLMNGPSWTILLGRRDSTTASLAASNNDIPPPTSTLSQLISKFQAKGLSVQELVALSGSHTIGQARCTSFKDRLYNFSNTARPDSNFNQGYLKTLQRKCPRSGGDNNTSPLDFQTPTGFDNAYFSNIVANEGLLNSDQVLYAPSGSSSRIVSNYEDNPSLFFRDFANAMVKMGNLSPLTGKSGQIRKNCRVVNS